MLVDDLGSRPEAVDRGRHATVDRRLQQHFAKSASGVRPLFSAPRGVGFDLVGAAERREHGEHDHAAFLAAEAVARPGTAPAVLVQQLLQGFAELGGVVQGGIDVLVAQHFAPDFKPAFFLEFSAVVGHLDGLSGAGGCESKGPGF